MPADLTLAAAPQAQGFIVHTVGDCTGVGYIEGAMHGAARAALEISEGTQPAQEAPVVRR